MEKEDIKKALDHFENDEFVDAKDIMTKAIQGKRDEFLKDKLGLDKDINPEPAKKEDDKEDDTEV